MKFPTLFLSALLLMVGTHTPAQTADDSGADTPPPAGETVIYSDKLASDQVTHVSVFTGNVVVIGDNFKMTCEEMTVNFTKDNKVDTIVSTGNVIINQPDRVTNCGRADYYHDDDKFVLTDQPVIHDHQNILKGTVITIFRTSQKMIVNGGRSSFTIGPGGLGAPKNATPAPAQ
jgi:lipopolysaccharide transport protein LptA